MNLLTKLSPASIEILSTLKWRDNITFTSYYQNGTNDGKFITFQELLAAFANTQKQVKQFEVSPKLVASLEKAIFQIDNRLKRDPLIHCIDGNFYLVGGRHRVAALQCVFDLTFPVKS